MLKSIEIALQKRLVDFYGHVPGLGGIYTDKDIHLAAADVALYRRLHRILRKEKASRQPNGRIEITVVYALELDSDLESFNASLGAAVAGHAFDHSSS